MKTPLLLLVLLVGLGTLTGQAQTIRYVKAGGTGDGSSWTNASGNLQAMISSSGGSDQVWVAAGTYKPTAGTDRTISFLLAPDVAIYGGFVGNETSLSARPAVNPVTGSPSNSILSGDIGTVGDNSDNSYHVINNTIKLTTTAILDGFVITGGNANLNSSGSGTTDEGGGMRNYSGDRYDAYMQVSPLIQNCFFVSNSALEEGGAICNDAIGCVAISPTLINCLFQSNTARAGGAIANKASTFTSYTDLGKPSSCAGQTFPRLTNCSFLSNSASYGGAMYNNGTGIYGQSNPTLTNCSFQSNTAIQQYGGYGGAIYNSGTNQGRSYPELINCSFLNNTAKGDPNFISFSLGGAIYNDGSDGVCDATLTNCSFQGNTADVEGGAMESQFKDLRGTGECIPTMINCVVFGNGGAKTFGPSNNYVQAYYSLFDASVTGWLGGNGRGNRAVTASPFASTTNMQLAANSPAINAGDPATTTATVGATDLAGNPRIVGCKIDMGALEYQYSYLPLAINAQPASSSVVCAGTSVSVPVSVSGTVSGYQWYKDSFSNPVAGQTSATLTLSNPQPGNAGSYSLVVTSTCNALTTTAFNLTVNKPTVSISPSSATVCQGQSALLTASGASTYTWSDNTTGNTLTATTTGTYSVTGVDGTGCSSTASSQVTVYRPTVSISPRSVSICEGQSALLTASGASTYTWSDNTTGNTLIATMTGTYSVTGVDSNGCSNTATASVTVNSLPTVSISASPAATITQGNSVTLTAVATGATALIWVTGSTSSSIVVSPATSTPYSITARSGAGCVASANLTISVVPPVCGPVIYVTQQGAGQRDGSNWDNALGATQLQLAINTAAGCGGQVWVAVGTYKPTSTTDRTISFTLKNGVAIYGGFAGNETSLSDRPVVNPVTSNPGSGQPSSTTLSGDIGTAGNMGDNSYHVINNPASLRTTAVLDGFVITGGAGGTLGGGMFNDGSSPTIRNCSFVANSVLVTSNSTARGGGMYNANGSSPQLINCSFQNNSVLGSAGISGSTSYGGAIANLSNSSPQLTNCNFVNNSVSGSNTNLGGAIANNISSNPLLTNCSFINNSATGGTTARGGAMNNGNGCNPQLTNCSFLSNSVSGGTANQGGAIGNNTSSVQLTNCVVFDNGGVNTLYNGGTTTPAITMATYSLFDNMVTGYSSDPTNLTVSTSPFSSPASVALAANSPAIDAGLNSAPGLSGISTDLAGNPRIVGCQVDLGALEFQGSTNQTFSIITQPAIGSAVCIGSNVSVPVSVSGTVSGYQWYKDSFANPVAGQTSATLTLGNLQPGNAGSYSLVVAGACNSLTSTAFSLTVNSPPTVASAGVSQTVLTGMGASLAANSPTVGMGNWSVVSGPSTNQAQFSDVANPVAFFTPLGGTGSYALVWTITNAPCTPSSSSLTITVLPANTAPVATVNANQTATVGTAFSYTINAFTDETPARLTYTASISPSNGFSFDVATRVISGTPVSTGSSSVTITATDADGLSASTSFSITTRCFPLTASISGSLTVCADQGTNLTASGGDTYLWSTGENTASISATAGAYSVTATTNGCSATASATVTANPLVTATLFPSSSSLTCAQTSVTLTAGGGSAYTFSAGATQIGSTNQAVVASAGTYSVTVTNGATGCASTTSVTVSQDNAVPTADITPSSFTLTCASPMVSLTASGGGSYVWDNATTSAVRSVTAAGTYSVTVTNGATGCASTTSVTVSQDNAVPSVGLVGSGTLTCAQTSVTLTASPSGLAYAFSGPGVVSQTSNTAIVNTPGLYSVTVTNGTTGCASTTSATVHQDQTPPTATLSASPSTTLSCAQTSLTLTAGGGSSYTFSGPGVVGQSGNKAVVNAAGTYSVTVTAANGCTSSTAISINQNTTTPSVSISPSSGTLTCNSPSLTLTANPVANPGARLAALAVISNLRWNTGATTSSISVSASGTYSVTYTAPNGCTASQSVSISQDQTPPTATLSASPSTTLSCSQTSLTLTAGGGSSYTFSGPGVVSQASNKAVVNAAGTYSVTATAANGCTGTTTLVISQDNSAPLASLVSSGLLSCNLTSVTLTASPAGQTLAYRFSAGATQIGSSNQATVSTSGIYSVTIISGNGCTGVASVSVGQDNTAPVATLSASPSTTLSCNQTSLTLTAGGGNTYTFAGPGVVSQASNQAVVNASGNYSVTVTNGTSGCTSTTSLSISQDNTAPSASLVSSGTLSCAVTSVTLTASAGGQTYRFSAGATQIGSGNTASVNTAGTYSVTVTSANGCSATTSTTVRGDQSAPTASLTNDGPLSCSKTSVTLTASGGGTYRFSAGATQLNGGNTASVNMAGTYSVTVTSANGCSATANTTVVGDQTAPTPGLTNNGPLSCTLTSVTLTASGGGTYRFSSGATQIGTSNQATVGVSGTYSVTVTGANGCLATAQTTVTGDQSVPTAGLTNNGPLTCSMTSVTLTAAGGTSYRFSNGASQLGSSNQATVTTGGLYSVTVTNADNGCSAVASTSVSANTARPTATISGNTTVTSGGSTTLTASGGTAQTWSTGETTSSITVMVGTYSVTVTNASGCSSSTSVTVSTVNSAPVATANANQTATVGVAFAYTVNAFTDADTPNSLTYTASISPANGFSFDPASRIISGTPSMSGVSSVTVTATDPGSLSANTSFTITVSPVPPTPVFSITGVTTVSCQVLSAGERRVSFNPRYAGLDGSPVSFSVVSELAPTTSPGPYSLNLYTDNSVITLRALQSGAATSFAYNWLSACSSSTANTPPTVANPVSPQSATVNFGYTLSLAGVFTDAETPNGLTLSVRGLPTGLNFSPPLTISGTPSMSGVSTVTVTATDPGSMSASTSFTLTVNPAAGTPPPPSGTFSITSVQTISCQVLSAGQRRLTFNPRYAGLNGAPVSFSVVNEMAPTTNPGPYSLDLYTDNSVITLRALQSGAATSFAYNWLSACSSSTANTPPTVANPVSPQSATVNFGYTLSLAGVFTDAETPNQLTLWVTGLPAGLNFVAPSTISGTPSLSGVSSVTVTATDPGSMSASTSFTLTVNPGAGTPPPTGTFSITGVQTISCEVLSAGQRRVTFNPQYAGLNGAPVSFSVVNELTPTTSPGPYVLNLYTDNPVISLRAVQSGVSTSFSYGWLGACNPGARLGVSPEVPLKVVVLGNPVVSQTVEVEVWGARGQPLRLHLTDERGHLVSEQSVGEAGMVERQTLSLGQTPAGVLLLRVSTFTQSLTLKLLKVE